LVKPENFGFLILKIDMLNVLVITGSLIVGLMFLVTGIVKALEQRLFISHLSRLTTRVFPPTLIVPAAIGFTIIECALGAVLILRLFPNYSFSITLGLLLVLSSITVFGTVTKRTEDCGCYTGLFEVSPQQSLALNCLYALLLSLSFFYPVPNSLTQSQQVTALCICLLTSIVLTVSSYLYYWRTKKPILNLMPIEINQRWNPEWFADDEGSWASGKQLVVFLKPRCDLCKHWLSVLKVIHLRPDMPNIVGGLVGTKEDVAELLRDHNLPFPIVAVKPSLARRLIDRFPSVIVLENGIIKDKWVGAMPREFVYQLKSKNN
jgi:hypothetical protein